MANTLDINKRYFRDGSGRVLARQLLAVFKEESLIPFWVNRTQNKVPGNETEAAFRACEQHVTRRLDCRWEQVPTESRCSPWS